MRWMVAGGMALALMACSGKSPEEKALANDPSLANYEPPSVMSRLDFGGVIERRFRRLDTNHDDKLEPSEIAPKSRARVMAFDTDHNGTVSVEEYSRGMLASFDTADINHDGTVTSDERDRAREGESDLPTPKDEPTNAPVVGNAQ